MRNLYTTRGGISRTKLFFILLMYMTLIVALMIGAGYFMLQRGVMLTTSDNAPMQVTPPNTLSASLIPAAVVDLSGKQTLDKPIAVAMSKQLTIRPDVSTKLDARIANSNLGIEVSLPITLDTVVKVEKVQLPTMTINGKTYTNPSATLHLPVSISTKATIQQLGLKKVQMAYEQDVTMKIERAIEAQLTGDLTATAVYQQRDVSLETVGAELRLSEKAIAVSGDQAMGITINAQSFVANTQ